MICVREKYQEVTKAAREKILEAYSFQGKTPATLIIDAPNWVFGELIGTIPEDYCRGNYKVMLEHQLAKIEHHFKQNYVADCYEPFLMPWYGTCVLSSGFGVECVTNPNMDPAVGAAILNKTDDVYELKIPDFEHDGMMPMVLEAIDYFRENCDLPIMLTDSQGPLSTALSLAGYENFIYWMYDEPEVIHLLMQKVTDAFIGWSRIQKRRIGIADEEPGYQMAVRTGTGKGGIVFSDDDSIILDAEAYREFVKPYNEQILAAFGGGCIHCCGSVNHQAENLKDTDGLTLYHNMTLDHLEDAAKLQVKLAEKGIAMVVGDFAPADDRIDSYYQEAAEHLSPQGLILASYIAPATALRKGKYDAVERDAKKLGMMVYEAIHKYFIPEKNTVFFEDSVNMQGKNSSLLR